MNPGDLISGKYRLQELLGSGGMGSVWSARNELTERNFAIKFLLPALAGNADALHRFFVEARASGRIKHPAVVEVYDVGQADDGSPYLVMELLEGEGLDQRLVREGRLTPVEVTTFLSFVARGLQEAHARGVVHRDLKPGNIFLSVGAAGEIVPKILDFGVSKATDLRTDHFTTTAGGVLGSPAYMSPEQARGETELDGRSDIWALGVILYQALTGQVPFEAPNYNALMVKISSSPYRPIRTLAPDVPVELAELVDRALIKDRSLRIGTALELAEELEALMEVTRVDRRRLVTLKTSAPTLQTVRLSAQTSLAKRTKRTSSRLARARSIVVAAVALVGAALVLAGAVAFKRHARSEVAVAASASRFLGALVERAQARSDELRAQRAEEERERAAREIEPPPAPSPGPSAPSPGSSAPFTPAQNKTRPTPTKRVNLHGGVEDPGF